MSLTKKGESEHDRMITTGRLASNKSKVDAEYLPIKIILKRNRTTTIGTCDVFSVFENNANGRVQKSITIQKISEPNFQGWVSFVLDPESYEMYCFIPKTDSNMRMLTSHYNELWVIGDEDIDRICKERFAALEKTRDVEAEHSEVGLENVVKEGAKDDLIKKLMEENQKYRTTIGLKNDPVKETEIDLMYKKKQEALSKTAKKIMQTKHKVLIEKIKEHRPKNWWLDPIYQNKKNEIMKELEATQDAIN